MIAVIPIRAGALPAGAAEAIAESAGRALIVGSGAAAADLDGIALDVSLLELGDFEPARWTAALAPVLASWPDADIVLLPNSPDGRDLAPRLAAALGRPLFAGATQVGPHSVSVARAGGRQLHTFTIDGPIVATLQPGVRGVERTNTEPTITMLDAATDTTTADATTQPGPTPTGPTTTDPTAKSDTTATDTRRDAVVTEVLPPDPRTMDLAEAARIVGGGAGLDSEQRFAQLDDFAGRIGATTGATRVITDRSWVHHDKQIGTTGVVVDPDLYLSFGVSGAVQHTAGLGAPDHIVSVNTDPHCPMMAMSDLAIVSDANATLDELLALLGGEPPTCTGGDTHD